MKFLIDEQLPISLARWLEVRGHAAEHVREIGLSGKSDGEVIRHAVDAMAVIVTKDEDFVASACQDRAAPVVWLRIGNVRNQVLLARMEVIWPQLLARLIGGETLIEIG